MPRRRRSNVDPARHASRMTEQAVRVTGDHAAASAAHREAARAQRNNPALRAHHESFAQMHDQASRGERVPHFEDRPGRHVPAQVEGSMARRRRRRGSAYRPGQAPISAMARQDNANDRAINTHLDRARYHQREGNHEEARRLYDAAHAEASRRGSSRAADIREEAERDGHRLTRRAEVTYEQERAAREASLRPDQRERLTRDRASADRTERARREQEARLAAHESARPTPGHGSTRGQGAHNDPAVERRAQSLFERMGGSGRLENSYGSAEARTALAQAHREAAGAATDARTRRGHEEMARQHAAASHTAQLTSSHRSEQAQTRSTAASSPRQAAPPQLQQSLRTGPRGGQYYLGPNGKKIYVR